MHDELVKRLRNDATAFVGFVGEDLRQAADAIDKLSKPRWISVEERLPPSDELVIVAIHDDSGDTAYDVTNVGFFLRGVNFGPEYGVWVVENERCNWVTHWMPLPEPPKEET